MTHGYRSFHNWNHWLSHHHLGQSLLEEEYHALRKLLSKHSGRHAVLIGVPSQTKLLYTHRLSYSSLLTYLLHKDIPFSPMIEADFLNLPIQAGSAELVLLPHTLELIDHPRQLLTDACRIIKPGGLIVICGLNPYSAWGVNKMLHFTKQKAFPPWSSNFLSMQQLANWLKLADFSIEKKQLFLFRPPIKYKSIFNKFNFIEKVGRLVFPFLGGAYIIVARAKVIPLTALRTHWKQQFAGIRIPSSISGHAVYWDPSNQ